MIIYRHHSGDTVYESVKHAKEFENEFQMKEYLENISKGAYLINDIVISEEVIKDKRINWLDTRRVCINRYYNTNYIEKYGYPQCIGYCATDYKIGENNV